MSGSDNCGDITCATVQVTLLKLERDRTAAALVKRFDTRVPVQKLLQTLQAELG